MSLFLITMSTLSVLIVFGNAAVIAAFVSSRRLRANPTNLLITSLAFADLMVGGVDMPAMITVRFLDLDNKRPSTIAICDLIYVIHNIFAGVTFHHLMVITLERFLKITRPFLYRQYKSRSMSRWILIAIWSSSALALCLSLFDHHYHQYCETVIMSSWIVVTMVIGGIVFIPAIVLTICNVHLYLIATKCKKAIENRIIQSGNDREKAFLRVHRGGIVIDVQEPSFGTSSLPRNLKRGSNCSQNLSRIDEGRQTSPNFDNLNVDELSSSNLENQHMTSAINPIANPVLSRRPRRLKEHLAIAVRQRKTALLISLIVMAMDGTWLPTATIYLMITADVGGIRNSGFDLLHPWLGFANSALNPIIIATISDDYRTAFQNIFRGVLRA